MEPNYEAFLPECIREALEIFPLEERLKGLPPEKVLEQFSVDGRSLDGTTTGSTRKTISQAPAKIALTFNGLGKGSAHKTVMKNQVFSNVNNDPVSTAQTVSDFILMRYDMTLSHGRSGVQF